MNYSRSEIGAEQAAEQLGSQSPQIMLPRATVIVTVDDGSMLASLDFVVAQTYSNFECIIVDDASSG